MMIRRKKHIGKILLLFCACLSIGIVANAASKTSTDVDITIEAGAAGQGEEDVSKQQMTNEDSKTVEQTEEIIQTGDNIAWVKYAVAFGVAAVAVIGCIWKRKKGALAVFALFFAMFFMNHSVLATNVTENVNVTIPTNISISFDESGENSISAFDVNNQSLVPITIEKIQVTEYNNWSLTEKGSEIAVNTKKLAFEIAGKNLIAGENTVSIPIAEQTNETMDIQVERGAWTTASENETALKLEFEYAIGKKEFMLAFDTNGSSETVATKTVYNGETVELPTLEREGYAFSGWEDEEGNLYTDQFIMPIGDATLKAVWRELTAYALYASSDGSLTFVQSADVIKAGQTHNGKTVTTVYTGFEETAYTSYSQVPWYADGTNENIKSVVVEDTIKPISTAYWFYKCQYCKSFNLTNLNTSNVTDMSYMCAWAGAEATTFQMLGVNNWDVSNVTKLNWTFANIGYNAPTVVLNLSGWDVSNVTSMVATMRGAGLNAITFSLGDLTKWDVSKVRDMQYMFMQAGLYASWSLDLRSWRVPLVARHDYFNSGVVKKVTAPNWVQ